MVFDDEPDWLVHLRLRLPTLRQMAARADPPPPRIEARIIDFLNSHVSDLDPEEVEPYWIEATLRRARIVVTPEQVAGVLVRWLGRRG